MVNLEQTEFLFTEHSAGKTGKELSERFIARYPEVPIDVVRKIVQLDYFH